jgi:hypothetical protein
MASQINKYVNAIAANEFGHIRIGSLKDKAPIGNQTLHVFGALINNGMVVVAE